MAIKRESEKEEEVWVRGEVGEGQPGRRESEGKELGEDGACVEGRVAGEGELRRALEEERKERGWR